jgi:BirA family transcriptional regulator, biotin operon repressor / biotin---[acetyl-CoA-carboxylase] ligase
MTVSPPLLPAAYRLILRESVGSTNDEAKELARAGAAEGTIVCGLQQTAGRGRRGRSWSSPPGNLYTSIILRPACTPEDAAQLAFVAALGVGEALLEQAPALRSITYKWPNDVLAGGRKIAGILLESETGENGNLAFLIVGVGINLASAPPDAEFPATSLVGEGMPAPTPEAALAAFVRHFDRWVRRWREEGFGPVREVWRAGAFVLGEPIHVRLENATLYGRFIDIDQRGALLLEVGGERRRISAGDVFPAR